MVSRTPILAARERCARLQDMIGRRLLMRVGAPGISLALLLVAPATHAWQAAPPPQEPQGDAAQQPAPVPQVPEQGKPAATPKVVTVGEFLVQVATALKLPAPKGGFNLESATFALRGKGVQIETPATSVLTEADVVKVMDALGYRVVTKTPSRTVNDQQVKLLIATFLTTNPSS